MIEVGPELLNYFERRVGEAGADLLSELMTTAWRRNSDLPTDHEQARMWLFGVARNLLRNSARSNVRQARLANALRDSIPSNGPDPAEQLAIRDAVKRLDPDLAEIVTLVHWEGLTIAEAGQLQGVPASTARGRYQRAKEALREALTEQRSRA
ncbi:RNA polymerase sigma factor [Agromyces sp. NPDC056965]|uniref:RNA polymerase sigma factor n=1 Tax=Agromyces sp. NPDC056965 TaxID=3345983 RepID=UPI0036342D92